VEWLNNPITQKYISFQENHALELERQIINISKADFCGKGITRRSDNEISFQTRLAAVDILLNDFKPLIDFVDQCQDNDIEPDKAKEEILIKELTIANPLNDFINKLYKNEK
jgi:hypothetical protein